MKKKLVSSFMTFLMMCSLCFCLPNYNITAHANCTADDMLNACRLEIGNTSGYHKRNKYTVWNGSISGYNDGGYGYPWCATYISYCAYQAGCLDIISKTASCSVQWTNTKGEKHTSKSYVPQPGDLIYFGNFDHVGIVESYDSSSGIIHTIEGNYDQKVTRVNRAYNSYVYGFISPSYSNANPILPTTTVDTYVLPQSFTCDSKIHVYDRYGKYQDNHYVEPNDYCTIDAIYSNDYVHIIYPINGVNNGDYYGKLSDFERWLSKKPTTPQGSEMMSGAGKTIPDGNYVIVSELGRRIYLDIPGTKYPADKETGIAICEG